MTFQLPLPPPQMPPPRDARTDEQKAADTAAMRRRVAERLVADRELQGALDDLRRRIQTASDIFWRGGYREAVLQLQDIASKAHDIPHGKSVECEALRMCGHGLIRLRQFTPAKQCLSTCLEIAQSIGSASLEANARVALGQLASNIDPPITPPPWNITPRPSGETTRSLV